MQIIAETGRRRAVYCPGRSRTIGPGLQLDLNVAIRTLVAEDRIGGRCGWASGRGSSLITQAQMSTVPAEARFMSAAPFELLETMRWAEGSSSWRA